ncbi:MAG: hypothetical protein JXA10_10795 [Anaerolineae bacterium]|nr:hypothetical protein [Anaerolineae bacterium]
MKTYRKTVDDQTYFVVTDVDPVLHDALRGMMFAEFEEGFARSFPSDAPHYKQYNNPATHLDQLFENFTRYTPDLILQSAKQQPVPWEKSLLAFLDIIQGHEFDWYLVGSGALAVRGLPVEPGDLDLVVQGQSTIRLSELLLDYMVEPVIHSRDWVGEWFCRTFLHARFEWVGDVNPDLDDQGPTDFGPTAIKRCDTIVWHGHAIKVPPLDLQLAVCEARGLTERAKLIQQAMKD